MRGSDSELLVRLPFDRYQRYGLTARILSGLPNGHQPLRLLEVGAHSHCDLQRFLPAERLVYLDVKAPLAGTPGGLFVHGDATSSPFAELTFDAAIALDVLEHVPPERRGRFLSELLRTSRRAVVLAAPFHAPEVVAEEIRLNAYYHDVHGHDFPWLAEHRLRGLPDLEETVRRIESEGWTTTVLGHGNVLLWARLMQAHLFVNSEPDLLQLRAEVDRLYNSELFAHDWAPPVYRHFVVATTSAEDARHLRGLLDTSTTVGDAAALRLQDHLEHLYEVGLRQRASRQRAELARWTDEAAARAHVEDEIRRQGETIAGLERTLHDREQSEAWALRRIDELNRRVEREELLRARIFATKSWRVTAPLRAIEPTVRLLATLVRWRLHRMRLEPLNQLVVEDGSFRSTGDDPMFLLSSSRGELPRSWAFLSCDTESEGQWLDPKLYLDTGSGFSEQETVKLPLRIKGRIEALVRLPNRVRALRFDPMSAPGRFSIRGMTVREIGLLQVGAILLFRHLRPALLQPRGLVRLARRVLSILKTGGVKGIQRRLVALDHNVTDYQQWVAAYDTLSDADRLLIRQHSESLPRKPLISVVMATYNTPERWLRLAIDSVLRQLYPHWELCIADDGSEAPHVRRVLEEYQDHDPRITVVFRPQNGHISAATNSALELARGEHVAFLDHDDELSEHALYIVAAELAEHPDAALIYSDEDKIDESGRRHGPYFKPDWNPDLFLAQNLVTHLCVCRTDLVRELGGLRLGYEGAQDWDLVMRLAEGVPPSRIRHIPHVLYHWRGVAGSAALGASEKSYVCEAQRKVLAAHFERVAQPVGIEPVAEVYWRIRYPLPEDPPLVSLIIPTRDRYDLLRRCIDSIFRRTTYPSFEIILLDNQTTDPRALKYLGQLASRPNVKIVRYDAPFNYSAINNFAVRHSRGAVLALINNDVEVITRDWLEEMVSQALRPKIGAVGAMLYYPNDTIQHAGVILGLGGVAGHAYSYRPRGYSGQASRAFLVQNLSAVTAACMVLRREVFEEVGGLDETHLPIAYNDVDLCLRIRQKGYRILWTPYAELYHHESASRGSDTAPTERARSRRELDYMKQPWGELLRNDPAYNPNLALDRESFALTFPPRAHKPWFRAADAA